MFGWIARMALKKLLGNLLDVSDEELKEIAAKANAKVDVPLIPEEAEGKIIYATIKSLVEITRELLRLI